MQNYILPTSSVKGTDERPAPPSVTLKSQNKPSDPPSSSEQFAEVINCVKFFSRSKKDSVLFLVCFLNK